VAWDYDAEHHIEKLKQRVFKLERQLKPIPLLIFRVGTVHIPPNDLSNYLESIKDQFKYLNGYYEVVCIANHDTKNIEVELLAVDPQEYETALVDKLLGKFIMEKEDD
jgi:hypothetical protein